MVEATPGRRVRMEDDLEPVELRWFQEAIDALHREGIPFLLAGAFGLYQYTGFWRGTKDLDVLVLPEHREIAVEAVTSVGLQDLFSQQPYDREWIFRSTAEGVIVDLIWQLPNKADQIAPAWMARGVEGRFFSSSVRYLSAADLCWMKLLVFQLHRCDWPDILNVIRGTRGQLDWQVLLENAGPHWQLLSALVEIHDWLCPSERYFIPAWFRAELGDRRAAAGGSSGACRADLFDSRSWLARAGGALG